MATTKAAITTRGENEVEGIVFKIDDATHFEIVVLGELNATSNVALGNPVVVTLSSAQFQVDANGLNVPGALQGAFEQAADTSQLMPGQEVQIRSTGGGSRDGFADHDDDESRSLARDAIHGDRVGSAGAAEFHGEQSSGIVYVDGRHFDFGADIEPDELPRRHGVEFARGPESSVAARTVCSRTAVGIHRR